MAKFKPVKAKKNKLPTPKPWLPCLLLVLLGMGLIMLILYFVMRSFAPSSS